MKALHHLASLGLSLDGNKIPLVNGVHFMPIKINPKERYIVYGLIDPNTNHIRYIGKSVSGITRVLHHKTPSSLKESNTHKNNWIKSLKANNQEYSYYILFVADYRLNKEEANIILYKVEQRFISLYRKIDNNLTNSDDGGPGVTGRKTSIETRKKMSETAKKRPLHPALLEQQKPKGRPLKKSPRTLAEGRKSRAIPGAREKSNNRRKILIRLQNSKETKIILGIKEAAKLIGDKCNKTGIRLAIKKQKIYYGYNWSFV